MENKGLLFIPDISGFTRFVNETDVEHSRLIIQELLELLINANQIGLEVSEIEGDAILFYKFGEAPELKQLYQQVERMFVAFHRNLIAYEQRRFCQCRACISAVNLTLKVITHYGEFTSYNVKNFSKLIGKDIIVAHQLMKNDIEKHEYWLVTQGLLRNNEPQDFEEWMTWESSAKRTENGEINFCYTQLSQLKVGISPELPSGPELSKMIKMISLSREYETDIITLFHATGDFRYRHLWQEGVKAVEEVNHFLPRVGMRCRCIMDDGQSVIYASSYSYQADRIEFSETDEERKSVLYYVLEKGSGNKTQLTVDVYIKKSIAAQAAFKLLKKEHMEKTLQRSLVNLDKVVRDIKLPLVDLP